MQMLVFVMLAAFWGIYNLVKKKPTGSNNYEQNLADSARTASHAKARRQFHPSVETIVNSNNSAATKQISKSGRVTKRDLNSGTELLELDLLLRIVDDTKGSNVNDTTMRKLVFNELLRREDHNRIDSNALKVYATNKDNLYGKEIQCEAIKELAERTAHTRVKTMAESAKAACG